MDQGEVNLGGAVVAVIIAGGIMAVVIWTVSNRL